MIPYGQKVVSDYLRSNTSVTAITNRIVSKRPENTETPWVQVRQLDATNAGKITAEHLIDFMFQVDCYADEAGGQPQADLLGRTVRHALVAEMPGVRSGTTITAAEIVGDTPLPDPDLRNEKGAQRDRRILTATVWMHS